MSPVLHIIAYIILISIFYNFSKNNIKDKYRNSFWLIAIIPIVVFSLVEGCRYDRGADYLYYTYRFEHINPLDEPQIIFLGLMKLLKFLGFDSVGAFITYSFLFITGTFFFIKKTYNRDEAQWIYFFALLAMTLRAENLIRQFIGQPFIFASIPFIFKRKWIPAVLLILAAINIHTGVLIQIPLIICSYFFIKKTFNWKIWILMLFFAYYVLPNGILVSAFTNLLSMLHLDSLIASDHVMHYIEDSDRWLGEGSVLEDAKQGFLTMTLQFLFEASVIYSAYKLLSKYPNQKVLFAYNIAVVGFILCRLFHGYEIFTRMMWQMYMYWFIPVGYSFYAINKEKLSRRNKINEMIKIKGALLLLCLYQFMFWSRFIFLNPDAKFFWDKIDFII